jgi:hypothetical protein
MHGAATISTPGYTSIFLVATLHIHVMRNASFGVIVANRYIRDLPRAERGLLLERVSIDVFRHSKREAKRIRVAARSDIDSDYKDDFEAKHATCQRQMFKARNWHCLDPLGSDFGVRIRAVD